MRLLHTTKLHLVEFQGQGILPSAILPSAIPPSAIPPYAFDKVAKKAFRLQWAFANEVAQQGLNVIMDSTL